MSFTILSSGNGPPRPFARRTSWKPCIGCPLPVLIQAVFARSRFVDLILSAAHLRLASAETGGPVESATLFPTMCLMHLQKPWIVKIQKRVIGRILKQSTAQLLLERNMNTAITPQVPPFESTNTSPGCFGESSRALPNRKQLNGASRQLGTESGRSRRACSF